jgi:hypothetical protein
MERYLSNLYASIDLCTSLQVRTKSGIVARKPAFVDSDDYACECYKLKHLGASCRFFCTQCTQHISKFKVTAPVFLHECCCLCACVLLYPCAANRVCSQEDGECDCLDNHTDYLDTHPDGVQVVTQVIKRKLASVMRSKLARAVTALEKRKLQGRLDRRCDSTASRPPASRGTHTALPSLSQRCPLSPSMSLSFSLSFSLSLSLSLPHSAVFGPSIY